MISIVKAIGSIFKKKAKEEGVAESTVDKIVGTVETLAMADEDVLKAAMAFAVQFEGKYSDLQTNFERVLRTIVRPVITLVSVGILFYMGLKGLDIPWVISWIGMTAVAGWFGARPFEKMKKLKKLSE